MRQLCLRAQRRKAGGAALDNAQIGTARALDGRRLQTVDLFLENLIDTLMAAVFHNAGSDSLGALDTLARDTRGILGKYRAVAADIDGSNRRR